MQNTFSAPFLLAFVFSLLSFSFGAWAGPSPAPSMSSHSGPPKFLAISPEDSAKLLANYAQIVRDSYQSSIQSAQNLEAAIETLTKSPSDSTLSAAREAWKIAKLSYAQTEAFRFYGGPIDDPEKGPEGLLNAWPIDESYLDYVKGAPQAGILQDAKLYPKLSKKIAASLNEKNGEKNISTGYHALEFLLWGQDFSSTGPGDRPFSDFVKSAENPNADRRKDYLKLLTQLLIEHLTKVAKAWDLKDSNNYEAALLKEDPKEALRKIFTGITTLSMDEMSGERMTVALENKDQENEQNCFSDLSFEDLLANQESIMQVYSRKALKTGLSLQEFVHRQNAQLAKKIEDHMNRVKKQLSSIQKPFDYVIVSSSKDPARLLTLKIISELQTQAKLLAKAGEMWNLELNVQ